MKISKTLRKPANWQDFESLCLLLWREEWGSEDIKKNGRNGQAQKGVDISGHRKDENEYSGIQCKCKPGNGALTQIEIDDEIENAKLFKPALRRLVFATTADKDVAIEEYVRIKDDENRRNGLFTIDIKSWQDIVDILDRNKSVLNIYMDIVADDYAFDVSFHDGQKEITIRPKYARIYHRNKTMTDCRQTQPEASKEDKYVSMLGSMYPRINSYANMFNPPTQATFKCVRGSIETNHSFCPLKFLVTNQGASPIDDYKIIFSFDNSQVSFARDNVRKEYSFPEISVGHVLSNISLEDDAKIYMYGNSIIPADCAFSDDFYVHFPVSVQEVKVSWTLLSRHFSTNGQLKLRIDPEYMDDIWFDGKTCEPTIKDYIEKEVITE